MWNNAHHGRSTFSSSLSSHFSHIRLHLRIQVALHKERQLHRLLINVLSQWIYCKSQPFCHPLDGKHKWGGGSTGASHYVQTELPGLKSSTSQASRSAIRILASSKFLASNCKVIPITSLPSAWRILKAKRRLYIRRITSPQKSPNWGSTPPHYHRNNPISEHTRHPKSQCPSEQPQQNGHQRSLGDSAFLGNTQFIQRRR